MTLRITFAFLLLSVGTGALAQPQISAVWPPAALRGGTATARVDGGNLADAKSVLISGSGVQVEMGKPEGNGIPVTLKVAPDAGPGPYEVRVLSPKGASNPGYLWVQSLPQIEEKEPNNQPDQAMKLEKLPAAVYGRSNGAEDVDWYQFHAEAGETFVFDIAAYRLYSPIDPFLELRDTENHLLGAAMEGYDRDPRLVYTFKKAGTYQLQVRDVMYRGGGGFVYSLSVGKLPLITSLTPAGGKRGETLTAAVEGVNLGDLKSVSIQIPADAPENRVLYVQPQTPNGPALPVAVAADDSAQAQAADNASAVNLSNGPVTLNGRIATAKGVAKLAFTAEAGKPVQINVVAHAIGSRLMPYVKILDSNGKEIQNTEEQIGRDMQVTFNPPANGTYRLEITSVDNQGGADYYYRVLLRPTGTPDFRITASPDAINLGKGQTIVVNVNVARRGGFGGEVVTKVEGLAPGITASPLTIPAGQSSGIVTLTAAPDAAQNGGVLRISGEGSLDGKTKVTRVATPVGSLPRPGEGQVVPRVVNFQMAAVTDAVPLFTLTPEATQVALAPGETAMVKVRVGRKPNDNNANPAIALTLASLPPGVTAETPTIPEKAGEVTIKLVAAANAQPATSSTLLTGKLGDNNVQPAPAIVITVKPKTP